LLLVGSPGSGKSMLAQRLSSLLPPMNEEEALSSAALASVSASGFDVQQWRQRPMRSPHHSASSVALVGGGSPPRPGEISLAHGGVLFLDELPEFNRACLESLREPLETGRITLSRAARQASYPAQFQLIAAMNPCPCGWLGAQAVSGRVCRCTPDAVNRYQSRISGPLLDRMDLQVEVPAVKPSELLTAPAGEKSATVAQRVAAAQTRQRARQGKTNAELNAGDMDLYCPLDEAAQAFAMRAAERMGWSGRSLHRVIKVARTIADLAEQPTLNVHHLAEAMQYRRGLNSA
jgi:magnesium chelatase family protein